MNDKITLLYNVQNEVTVLPNKFIDEYMIKADGEYVKIYLLILRLQGMGLPGSSGTDTKRCFTCAFLLGKSWSFTGCRAFCAGEDSFCGFYRDTKRGFFTDDYFCTGEDYIKSYGCGEFYEGYRS